MGVPRIFEEIYARIKERVTEKGKLNLALLLWAVEVGKDTPNVRWKRERFRRLWS